MADGTNSLSTSALAEITGQPCKTGCLRKPLIWRGVQRCFIILQLGFLPFGKVSPAAITDSSVAAADWNSFGQSIGPPGAALSAKATPVAEIATRVTESFGRTNGYLSQPRATSPATSAIFYTPLEQEAIGRLWRLCVNGGSLSKTRCSALCTDNALREIRNRVILPVSGRTLVFSQI
jgi:hypothetical protein